MIIVISFLTSRKTDNAGFYLANKKSRWYVVSYGMIGASLSGVTFISVPGAVGKSHFSYLVMVLGYLVGYFVIIKVLLPLYYRLNLTSIYTYLDSRFGRSAYKSGATFFLISRIIGASFRMFLVISVLQYFILDYYHIPFVVSAGVMIFFILFYTMKGGIKTIIWTDTIQTTFMLSSLVVSFFMIAKSLDLSFSALVGQIYHSEYAQLLDLDWGSQTFFVKHFFAGMFITIVMTGLDQDMMQKNLSCRNIKEAQKNMTWMSLSLLPINLLFLTLGAALYLYAAKMGIAIPDKADQLFPLIAIHHLGVFSSIVFIIGLFAANYASADSALTSLTTSMSVDIFDLENRKSLSEKQKIFYRKLIHIGMALILYAAILLFGAINKDSVINELFTAAGYTYGPLLGLFAFGLFTKIKVNNKLIPLIVIASPFISYVLNYLSPAIGYHFGFEILILNGALTYLGLWLIRTKSGIINH
jgi:Na+/proline symporter